MPSPSHKIMHGKNNLNAKIQTLNLNVCRPYLNKYIETKMSEKVLHYGKLDKVKSSGIKKWLELT